MCGATRKKARNRAGGLGLSPRVWGNRKSVALPAFSSRSIPTCVGQPSSWRFHNRLAKVYPHVCGATVRGIAAGMGAGGLSPRVWGNLSSRYLRQAQIRSIPTCVGQPENGRLYVEADEVYPHVCGATVEATDKAGKAIGLSPRVWGNRDAPANLQRIVGSIPTCVGQPVLRDDNIQCQKVYPHVCGATSFARTFLPRNKGLSPRVWGNRRESLM